MNMQKDIDESLIFTVSEVTLHLKQVIETQIEALYIVGEVSNFIRHSSGHIYLNIKDDNAIMRCAFFRNNNYNLDFKPIDGDRVICFGKIVVYEKSGQYQLLVQNMFPYGKGILQQRFEKLKAQLLNEGLFDAIHKKPLPKYPDTIGVITSPTGAALQDIRNILSRRYPCRLVVYPALMQGENSPKQNVKGIEYFNKVVKPDIIIIARGGGSQEDLFGFNDEELARSIFASIIPVISAIGHEIDFTIADFVADLRAPTPSAAAEIATPDRADILNKLVALEREYLLNVQKRLGNMHRSLQQIQMRILRFNPERVWQAYQQRYDETLLALMLTKGKINKLKQDYLHRQYTISQSLHTAVSRFASAKKQHLSYQSIQFKQLMNFNLQNIKHKLNLATNTLEELDPRKVLSRGYALVRKDGNIVHSIDEITINTQIAVAFKDGVARAQVTDKVKNKES